MPEDVRNNPRYERMEAAGIPEQGKKRKKGFGLTAIG